MLAMMSVIVENVFLFAF